MRKTPRTRLGRHGFTLVEMLLVLVILATLAAIVIPKLAGRGQQAKETAAKTQISAFEQALDSYEIDTGSYPAGGNGLNALVDPPANVQNWRGPYLKNIPEDPWGQPYIYSFPGKNNPGSYDLVSGGPDMRVGGDDDINNWSQKK
jgi:general secretion pathway protein G